jgi:hypothetical protein
MSATLIIGGLLAIFVMLVGFKYNRETIPGIIGLLGAGAIVFGVITSLV